MNSGTEWTFPDVETIKINLLLDNVKGPIDTSFKIKGATAVTATLMTQDGPESSKQVTSQVKVKSNISLQGDRLWSSFIEQNVIFFPFITFVHPNLQNI